MFRADRVGMPRFRSRWLWRGSAPPGSGYPAWATSRGIRYWKLRSDNFGRPWTRPWANGLCRALRHPPCGLYLSSCSLMKNPFSVSFPTTTLLPGLGQCSSAWSDHASRPRSYRSEIVPARPATMAWRTGCNRNTLSDTLQDAPAGGSRTSGLETCSGGRRVWIGST